MRRTIYLEPMSALELFEPAPETTYSIEEAARLAQVPRRLVLLGLIATVGDIARLVLKSPPTPELAERESGWGCRHPEATLPCFVSTAESAPHEYRRCSG